MTARRVGVAVLTIGLLLSGCTVAPEPARSPEPAPVATSNPIPSPSAPAAPTQAPTPGPTFAEPMTTNTLPPPPAPTEPEPTRSGPLTARSLPVPDGWKTTVLDGGADDGFLGNGTWVHGRDPRYAAFDTVSIGCAQVTRDDYTDPVAALEGTYVRRDEPGIGLTLQFADEAAATRFFSLYDRQLRACTDPDGPAVVTVEKTPIGLVARRSYPAEADWTEVVRRVERRVTLVALSDPRHRITKRAAAALLTEIGRTSRR